MQISGEVVVITGAAGGIGEQLARQARARGAATLVLTDLPGARLAALAAELGAEAVAGDLCDAGFIEDLVSGVEARHGAIGLMCCNAGSAAGWTTGGIITAPEDDIWQKVWKINVMSHVRLSRAALPAMLARGRGHFLQTLSAAGLLTAPGSAVYSATKHAAVGLAESLAIAHGSAGIGVSMLCPQGVDTGMLSEVKDAATRADGVMSAAEVARIAFDGVEAGAFLITPHERVRRYMARKTADYDGWIRAMQAYASGA